MGQKIVKYVYLVSVIFMSCSEQNKNSEVEVFLDNIELNTVFSLDTISLKGWDTVYILKPYSNLQSLKTVSISNELKKKINASLVTESLCVLVFTKNNKLLYYSHVFRSIADFSTVEKEKYPSDHIYLLNDCRKVVDQQNGVKSEQLKQYNTPFNILLNTIN